MDKEASSSPSGFFKFVTAQSLQEGSLQIPKSFVDHHGNCFQKHVCLEVPTDGIWKVELRRSAGRVWLDKGWPEFADCNSIKEGYYLVFKHEGGSFLHVLVFSKTGFEIKYPAGSAFTTPKVSEIEDEDEDTDVSSDDYGPIYDLEWPRTSRKSSHTTRSTAELLVNRSGKGKFGERGSKKIVSLSALLKLELNCARYKRRVLEKSGIFKSEKPHFILYITPTCVASNIVMRIPAAHFKRHLKKDYNCHGQNDMVLRGSKGRVWRVQFTVSDKNPNDVTFGDGWREFVKENELKEGDVCVFEMINVKVKEYKATIFSRCDYA